MSIFDDIASGADRLRRGEDTLIWRMRAAGSDWREIGTTLLTRRAARRDVLEAQIARSARANAVAKTVRAQLRSERAGA